MLEVQSVFQVPSTVTSSRRGIDTLREGGCGIGVVAEVQAEVVEVVPFDIAQGIGDAAHKVVAAETDLFQSG